MSKTNYSHIRRPELKDVDAIKCTGCGDMLSYDDISDGICYPCHVEADEKLTSENFNVEDTTTHSCKKGFPDDCGYFLNGSCTDCL
jgi:hypothetical protein